MLFFYIYIFSYSTSLFLKRGEKNVSEIYIKGDDENKENKKKKEITSEKG